MVAGVDCDESGDDHLLSVPRPLESLTKSTLVQTGRPGVSLTSRCRVGETVEGRTNAVMVTSVGVVGPPVGIPLV